MTIRKILVASDFSKAAKLAATRAARIADHLDAELVLLHVSKDVPADLEDLAAELRAFGVDVQVEHRTGHADEAIVKAGAELGVDLIVTSTHGRSGLKRFLLGSVAEKVVRASTTNVLVVRGAEPPNGFNKVLVPTDFSPASKKAAILALELASPGATVELFHAWQFPPGTHATTIDSDDSGPLGQMRAEITQGAETQGSAMVSELARDDIDLRFDHAFGPPAVVVDDRLEAGDYDLVAMGTHGYRGFRRFLLGSVAEAMVRHSPCSVLIAHAENV